MSPLLLDLPDDLLVEILGNLPALSILVCKKVCHKLNRLSNIRYVWITAFNQTQHMLRPVLDPVKHSLPQLQLAMARAEKLDQIWSDEDALHDIRPRATYCSQGFKQRCPLTVMGEFIVYVEPSERAKYQWISMNDRNEENIAFEYEVPVDSVDARRYMDHAADTFYLLFLLGAGSQENHEPQLQIVEVKVDTFDSQPRVVNTAQIILPEDHRIEYFALSGHFVYFKIYNSDLRDQFCLDILNLRTKSMSEVNLLHPPWFSPIPGSIWISDAYILSSAKPNQFTIFRRPGLNDLDETRRPSDSLYSRTQLHVAFSGVYPPGFPPDGCLLTLPMPTLVSFKCQFESSTIHLQYMKDFEVEELVKGEYTEIVGLINGCAFSDAPPGHSSYTLGMVSTTKYETGVYRGMREGASHIYAFRFDGKDLGGNRLKTVELNLSRWANDSKGSTCVIDFNPFSGIALLASGRNHAGGQDTQIIVLDFLCTE